MKNFSLTMTGLMAVIFAEFVPQAELEVVIQAIGILVAWYGRYRMGDLKPWGIRK